MMEPVVLFVNDDPAIPRTIERLFRQSPFQFLTASNSDEALLVLHEIPVSVVVDERMNATRGIHSKLAANLNNALTNDMFILHNQPKIDEPAAFRADQRASVVLLSTTRR